MTTATTSTALAHSSTATFQAWVNEICTQLITTCGITQTSDTGQCWSPGGGATCAYTATINSSQGYVILRFNDTLQATVPVFIKLEFGTAQTALAPGLWITVGTGSSGAGVINGTVMTRVASAYGIAPISTTTNYSSYFTYNSTYGFLAIAFKQGSTGGTQPAVSMMGFVVSRGSTSTGAANSDAVFLMSVNSSATFPGGALGTVQSLSYSTSIVYPPVLSNGTFWNGGTAYGQTNIAVLSGMNNVIVPVYYMAPTITISGVVGVINNGATNYGNTFTAAILGSTVLTFLNVGGLFGPNLSGSNLTAGGNGAATNSSGLAILWQ